MAEDLNAIGKAELEEVSRRLLVAAEMLEHIDLNTSYVPVHSTMSATFISGGISWRVIPNRGHHLDLTTHDFTVGKVAYHILGLMIELEPTLIAVTSANTGRHTTSPKIENAAQEAIQEAAAEWRRGHSDQFQEWWHNNLGNAVRAKMKRVLETNDRLLSDMDSLERDYAEWRLPPEVRPLFIKLLGANPTEDPAEVAEAAQILDADQKGGSVPES